MSSIKIIAYMAKNPGWHFGLDLVAQKLCLRSFVYAQLAELENLGLVERRPEPNHEYSGLPRHQFRALVGFQSDADGDCDVG